MKLVNLCFCGLAFFALAGCATSGDQSEAGGNDFDVVAQGVYSQGHACYHLVMTREEGFSHLEGDSVAESILIDHIEGAGIVLSESQRSTVVDAFLSGHQVGIIASERQPSGGYGLSLEIDEREGIRVLSVDVVGPDADEATTQAITRPWKVLILDSPVDKIDMSCDMNGLGDSLGTNIF